MYRDYRPPAVVVVALRNGRLWAWCEDCDAHAPVVRAGQDGWRMAPHRRAGTDLRWHLLTLQRRRTDPARRWDGQTADDAVRDARRSRTRAVCTAMVAWGRKRPAHGPEISREQVAAHLVDHCAPCPVAVYARRLQAEMDAAWRVRLAGRHPLTTPAAPVPVQADLFGGAL